MFWRVMSFAASNETAGTHEATKDGTSLIDTIAASDQVLSVINDTGDHVLKLSFMDSSSVNQSFSSQRRYFI